ncbi:MAG: adenylyltransferase/cytidyltransferase family protein [Chloroflexi bacterium]|nr:adenylyltransferase/cytidyltransferase family protein [Chloroflexota bacterium]
MTKNSDKIKSLQELAEILSSLRASKRKVIQCHGVFDLLHIGHIRHFEQARKLGDTLIVTVTPDKYVNKGPHRPAFTEDLRAEFIAALDCVDYVAINQWPTAVETIKLLKPDIYAKGADYQDAQKDYTGKITEEEAAIKSVGGEIAFTDDITFSSSSLINRYLSAFPREVSDYLTDFSGRHSSDEVLQYLEKARSLKVLVIGEAIIDEYQYCEAIGKSAKEPVLATRYLSTEKFAGGVLAVANHVANFCDNVGLLTFLGEEDPQEDFVREQVKNNVDMIFLYKANSPTIVKRRFVESYLLTKLFEVYVMNDAELNQKENQALCRKLRDILPRYDVVIVVDYGHGMLSQEAIDVLCRRASFLAVNTQANAGNRGFNTILKYPRADYVCIAEYEIRLECRNQRGDLKEMILDVAQKLGCGQIIVTRGRYGSLAYSKSEGFIESPAFTEHVVDRMGSGDAVLSLTSLYAAQQIPMAITGFIGNVVGAEAVATVGNRTSIERASLSKHIVSLLK